MSFNNNIKYTNEQTSVGYHLDTLPHLCKRSIGEMHNQIEDLHYAIRPSLWAGLQRLYEDIWKQVLSLCQQISIHVQDRCLLIVFAEEYKLQTCNLGIVGETLESIQNR